MKLLRRNKTTFYYQTFENETMLTDSLGYYTGERGASFSEPIEMKGYIVTSKGSTLFSGSPISATAYGLDIDSDKTIYLEGIDLDIKENSKVIIKSQNYHVSKIAESLNHTAIEIKREAQ